MKKVFLTLFILIACVTSNVYASSTFIQNKSGTVTSQDASHMPYALIFFAVAYILYLVLEFFVLEIKEFIFKKIVFDSNIITIFVL